MRWPFWILPCLCACSADPTGHVRVVVAPARASAEITRVSVDVHPAGVSADLARGGGGAFTGTVRVPVGTQTVVATAWAGAAAVASGSGSATVAKGVAVPVAIRVLDATGRAPQPDHSPVITSLVSSAAAVAIGEQVALAATAFDADGDPIAWSWSAVPAGCGAFTTPDAPSTTWVAAANGRCSVSVTATARSVSDRATTSILVGAATPTPTPTLVQHLSSNTNEINGGATDGGSTTPRNDFRFTLPNPVIAGNVLVLGLTMQPWPAAAIGVTGITDSSGDTWSPTAAVSTGDGISRPRQVIFVHPVTNAGIHTITITLSTAPATFQYTVSEFAGIDGTIAGTSSSTGWAPTIDAGTFVPANNDGAGGNLIWALFSQTGDAFQAPPTDWTPGGGFTLLDADLASRFMQAHASMYGVQTAAGQVTPSITLTDGGSQGYQGIAVALKAAPVGNDPAPGIRIHRILHTTNGAPPTTWRFKVPSSGNKLVLVVNEQDIVHVTRVTDNKGNTYAGYLPPGGGPQFWYTTGTATTGHDLVATVTSSGTPVNATALWYDISGADTVDQTIDGSSGGPSCTTTCPSATYDDAPSFTPLSTGLTIAACYFGTGPSPGFASGAPAGAIFDYVWYTGITDASRMDNSDCRAHLYNSDLATQHWNWAIDWQYYDAPVTGTTAGSSAIHVRALGAGP